MVSASVSPPVAGFDQLLTNMRPQLGYEAKQDPTWASSLSAGGAKARAAEIEVVDGPNDEGEIFTRPGKLSDRFPQPYANEQAAQFANGGAYPPDPSLITKALQWSELCVYSPDRVP